MRIGIDVGGTFTDVVLVDQASSEFYYTKTPTTHENLADGVMTGLEEILGMAGREIADLEYLIHGTTIGTNAIVEGKGAKVGLITTEGFQDVLEIRRVARPKEAAFDFEIDNPPPLVPRYLRLGVAERVNSAGEVIRPLDRAELERNVEYLKAQEVEAIVLVFLFSFLNPEHEQQAAALCKERFPELFVSISSDVSPEFREYERTCTTVMNGYLGPVIRDYMDNLRGRLAERYGHIRLHIMQSNGGSTGADVAADRAAHLINSGPAGGAMAAAFLSKAIGRDMAIGADMGGTTFDISIIDRGMPKTTTWGGVTNYPIKLPMVDLKTIGAGGGSIAWVDKAGVPYVGPQSAGSNPGPACYGWGGTEPTVSDANLVLGRLDPSYFLGGKLSLDVAKAREAIWVRVARPLGKTVEEAALSIVKIANANMVKGISAVSVERGYDPRDFVLIPFGGAAANHAVEIAAELGISEVVVPSICGNFSAVGLVVTDVQHDYVKTVGKNARGLDPALMQQFLGELEDQAVSKLVAEQVSPDAIVTEWFADLRYEGQSWELTTPVCRVACFGQAEMEDLFANFHALHKQVYSYSEPAQAVEIVNLRVRGIGRNPAIELPKFSFGPTSLSEARKCERVVYLPDGSSRPVPIYERSALGAGTVVPGPCVIEERLSTTFLPADCSATVDEYLNLVIDVSRLAG